ncbi:ATP-binding protein [Actinomadura sp. WAC 06369]|uniref:ATP-binding protein n=1 Tax=Actinomadura sp. WAC 06369 TaxID=2203193 RepID=UPI0013150D1E|nr:ATP-binding protein [Actinomadura sp. WAC 06369]
MTPVTATRPPRLELTLTVNRSEVSRARHAVARTLEDLGRPELVADASLIVSELVTNAIQQSEETLGCLARNYLVSSRIMVKLYASSDGWSAVEVWDAFPHKPPQAQATPLHQEGGRGLFVVGELSQKWGYYLNGAWKCVWAVLASPSW